MSFARRSSHLRILAACASVSPSAVLAAWNAENQTFDAADAGKCCGYSATQIGPCVQSHQTTRNICIKEIGQPGYPWYPELGKGWTTSPGAPVERDFYQCCSGSHAACGGKSEGDTCLAYAQDGNGPMGAETHYYKAGTGKCVENRNYRQCVDNNIARGAGGGAAEYCYQNGKGSGALRCEGAEQIIEENKGRLALPGWAIAVLVVGVSTGLSIPLLSLLKARLRAGQHAEQNAGSRGLVQVAPAPTTGPYSAVGVAGKSVKQRLEELESIRDVISAEDYEKKKAEIMATV